MDFTEPEDQDWLGDGRRQPDERSEQAPGYNETFGTKDLQAATRYSEGEKVRVDGQRGVIVEVRTEPFEGPDGDDWDASGNSPVYVVGTVDGAVAVTASDIEQDDWDSGQDSPDEDLADAVAGEAEGALTASIQATLNDLDDPFDPKVDGTLEAGPTDWDYPDSWTESDIPARLILLDAWASMGGQFDCGGGCCKGTMMSSGMSDGASDRFCAAMKDRVLMWEGWR